MRYSRAPVQSLEMAVLNAQKKVIGGLAIVVLVGHVGFERWICPGEDGVQQFLAAELRRGTTSTRRGALQLGHRHAAAWQRLSSKR
jgi:hypothetical protein